MAIQREVKMRCSKCGDEITAVLQQSGDVEFGRRSNTPSVGGGHPKPVEPAFECVICVPTPYLLCGKHDTQHPGHRLLTD